MQTLVLRISDDLAKDLEAEALRLNVTKSEVARRRLSNIAPEGGVSSGFDLIADLVGTVKGGPTDMSARKKHHLKTTGYGKKKRAR